MAEKLDKKQLADKIKRRFLAGVAYKRSQGFYDKWREYQSFWEAEQWPQPTPDTETLPRPVINHFASIIEQKVAALLAELPEIYFEPKAGNPELTDADEAAYMLTQMAKYQSQNLGGNDEDVTLEELLEEGVRNAALFGTGIWCFVWDNDVVGGVPGVSAYVGNIVGECVDPTMFFPGNPADPSIQTQPWIILAERRNIEDIKNYYRPFAGREVDEIEVEQVQSETLVYEYERVEQEESGQVTVLHYWWKVTDPETGQKKLNYAVECQGRLLRYEEELYQHGLYPFVVFRWYPRSKNFWGKPESPDLLNNQKEMNRLDAIMLLSAYTTGMPHIRYKRQFVDPRDITNDPGTLIADNTPQGWGVDYMPPPPMPGYVAAVRSRLLAELKDAAGVHEAWAGKAPGRQLNASAIIALQEAAGMRIRLIQRRLQRALQEIGKLWLAYWKEFCTEARLIRITTPENQTAFAWFRGADYRDMLFDVRVRAAAASPYSRALYMANLDALLQRNIITPEEYLELLPAEVFPKAPQILQRRRQQQEQLAALQALMQQQAAAQAGGQVSPAPAEPVNPGLLAEPIERIIGGTARKVARGGGGVGAGS